MTGQALKIIACVCMLIDHLAWSFVPTNSALGVVMHLVGRVTFPVMAFMISEGYVHTHDFRRYAERLALFALISDVPFMFFERSTACHNVMFSLLAGLVAVWAVDHYRGVGSLLALTLCVVAICFRLDWSFFGVLLPLMFWLCRGRWGSCVLSVVIVGLLAAMMYGQWWQFGVLLSLPFLWAYNGQRGWGNKWGFYAFYPGHLALLAALRALL